MEAYKFSEQTQIALNAAGKQRLISKRKWRECRWTFSYTKTSYCFNVLMNRKPDMMCLGDNSYPKSWSPQARYFAARKRLWGIKEKINGK